MPTDYLLARPGALSTLLHCPATGIPQPNVTWFKDNYDVSAMSFITVFDNGTLEILSVQDIDKGEYTCVASNGAGSDTATVTLDVGGEFGSPCLPLGIPHQAYSYLTDLKLP